MLINWTLVYFVHSSMPKLTGFWHLACYLFPVLLDIIGREGNLENMGCFTLLIDEKNLELKWLVVEALKRLLIPMKLYVLLIQATGAYISINKCCNWSDGVTYSIQVVEYAEYWRCQKLLLEPISEMVLVRENARGRENTVIDALHPDNYSWTDYIIRVTSARS